MAQSNLFTYTICCASSRTQQHHNSMYTSLDAKYQHYKQRNWQQIQITLTKIPLTLTITLTLTANPTVSDNVGQSSSDIVRQHLYISATVNIQHFALVPSHCPSQNNKEAEIADHLGTTGAPQEPCRTDEKNPNPNPNPNPTLWTLFCLRRYRSLNGGICHPYDSLHR